MAKKNFLKKHSKKAIITEWNSFDLWLNRFKSIALTRGIGWAILYYDQLTKDYSMDG